MTRTVTLTITKCGDCPHHSVGGCYSMDGFDRGRDWFCDKANRAIVTFVEWSDDVPKTVPDWCPLIVKKKGKK